MMSSPINPEDPSLAKAAPGAAGALPARRRRDRRLVVIVAGVTGMMVAGYLISLVPGRGVDAAAVARQKAAARVQGFADLQASSTTTTPEQAAPADQGIAPAAPGQPEVEFKQRSAEADAAIKAGQYLKALAAAQRMRELKPDHPASYVKAGFAFNGMGRFKDAFGPLAHAIDLDPMQADAYFGMAVVQEGLGNLEGAIGGMRTFLHVTPDPDPARLQVAQARAAIWEWESRLGRGPWGPTQGVPPGFTAEELRRDGRGVGVKMPVGQPDESGATPSEIKSGDKFRIFSR